MAATAAQAFGPEKAEESRLASQLEGSSLQTELSELSSALNNAMVMPQNILVKADFALASAVASYLASRLGNMPAKKTARSVELARATADLISPSLKIFLSRSGPVSVAAALRASASRIEKTVSVSKK